MKFTLRQLEVFCAIAENGHVTRAAQAVALTQAAASMALADLERQLGVVLFERAHRQLLLSEHGRMLLPHARALLDQAAAFAHLAQDEEAPFSLRIATSVTAGNHLVPGIIAALRQRWPNAQWQVARMNSQEVLEELAAHRIDAGFVEGVQHRVPFVHYPWKTDHLRLFVAPTHPLAGTAPTRRALQSVDWIVREPGSGTREVMDQACTRARLTPPIGFVLEQPEAIRQCVKAGLGIGCLSALELEDSLRARTLVTLDVPYLNMARSIDLVLLKGGTPGPGTRALLRLRPQHSKAIQSA